MTRIYTLVNQKGGVGKTTTTINLGAYLAQSGQRVLVVDLDPQANATSCLGVDKLSVQGGTYEALLGDTNIASYVLLNERIRLSLLPSSPSLAGAEIELVDELAREVRLRKAIEPLAHQYDYVLIDCPPSLGLLTVNGLMAAINGVIVPVQCEYLALEGLGQLTQTIDRVRSLLFPELNVRGVVLTMFDFHRCSDRSESAFPRSGIQERDSPQHSPCGSALVWAADFRVCAHLCRCSGV